MTLTREQTVIADIVLAALDGHGNELCRLLNQMPRRHHADAAAKSLDLMAGIFRSVIAPDDWRRLVNEARATRLLLDLDPQENPDA